MKRFDIKDLSLFVFLTALCFISVNSWSLWIDEAITAQMYSVGTFSDLLNEFRTRIGSEVQMPGWIFFMWLWTKIFGITEYALRSANFLFIEALIIYVLFLIKDKSTTQKEQSFLRITLLISILNPFILYNMNEARCNIPIFSLSFITILAFWSYLKTNKKSSWYICLISFLIGYTFNMLFGLLFFGLLLMSIEKKETMNILKQKCASIIVLIIFMFVVTIYYLITISSGKGGQIESPGVGNIGYSLYEFLGFGGLGPNKNALRESDHKITLILQSLILILPLLFCYFFIIFSALKKSTKEVFSNVFLKSFILGFILFFIVAYIVQFRFWGRHLIYIYPFWLLFTAHLLHDFAQNMKPFSKIILSVFILFISLSSFNILFCNKYKKENIKGISEKSLELRNPDEIIYWSEATESAWYYLKNDKNIKIGLPQSTETGLLVWFKRMKWINEEEYQNLIQTRQPVLIYENNDFIIYRLHQ